MCLQLSIGDSRFGVFLTLASDKDIDQDLITEIGVILQRQLYFLWRVRLRSITP